MVLILIDVTLNPVSLSYIPFGNKYYRYSYCKNNVYSLYIPVFSSEKWTGIAYIPGATAPFFAAGVVPLPAAGLGAGFAAALTGALAATGFLGGILKRNVKKKNFSKIVLHSTALHL